METAVGSVDLAIVVIVTAVDPTVDVVMEMVIKAETMVTSQATAAIPRTAVKLTVQDTAMVALEHPTLLPLPLPLLRRRLTRPKLNASTKLGPLTMLRIRSSTHTLLTEATLLSWHSTSKPQRRPLWLLPPRLTRPTAQCPAKHSRP